ncbi:MAG: hypothetical protein ACYS9Y_11720 [Planctomycetota bacterium]|jgi:hypothetical protein
MRIQIRIDPIRQAQDKLTEGSNRGELGRSVLAGVGGGSLPADGEEL